MKLWSGTLSPFSAKIRIYLGERNIPCDLEEVPWNRQTLWGPKPTAFLEANPRGEVPTLSDGDLAVFDSTLIWEYLEEVHSGKPLLPESSRDRALVRAWEDEADRLMKEHLMVLIREGFLGGGDLNALAASNAAFAEFYDRLNGQLNGRTWLGESYSIADIAAFVCLLFAQTLGAEIGNRARLAAWYARVAARDVVQQEVADILQHAAAA